MPKIVAASQHRPKREEAKAKELADLKRECHELRRTVSRLQKELNKRVMVEEEVAEQGLEEIEVQKPQTAVENCPKCGSRDVRHLFMNNKEFIICADCKWRAVT